MRHQARGFPRTLERRLRTSQTDAERLVWSMVHGRKLEGLKFRRQHPIGNFIIDVYCPRLGLAIELDGKRHFTEDGVKADALRDQELQRLGVTVLRFENGEVIANPRIVEEAILRFLASAKL